MSSRKFMATALVTVLTVAAGLAGCSSDSPETASTSTTDAVPLSLDPAAEPDEIDVVIGSVELNRMTTFAPEGWVYDEEADLFEDSASEASWQVTRVCPEPCTARSDAQWVNAADGFISERLAAEDLDPTRLDTDDLEPGRRFVVASDDQVVVAGMARWVSGSSEMIWCLVVGPPDVATDLVPVLEFACDNTQAALE